MAADRHKKKKRKGKREYKEREDGADFTRGKQPENQTLMMRKSYPSRSLYQGRPCP